ncbi:hypothetical protein IFR05_012898 [Cadophora sp. M221]|nr:hypothetical protein IFR05_012898 [Cadophora sp. M221]
MLEGRLRCVKSLKLGKAKAVKAKAEKKIAMLERPLSQLTKLENHVSIANIEAYVKRSAEDRRKEVETGKVPGKVKRPMNSFMLYRKAYQGRTKDWCLQKNHQIISQVCGNSWSLEPNHIKEQYSEWARLERINHQSAHPEYKFSPRKLGGSKASKVKVSKEVITEESKLGDFESQNSSKRGSKKHRPLHIMIQQPVPCPTTESAYQYTYPAAGYRIDLSQGERSLDRSNTHDPGLPSTYYDESHNSEHYWEDVFAAHDGDPMLIIDPTLHNNGSQIQDTSAHVLRGDEEGWHVKSLEDGDQFNSWMNEA